MATPPNFLTSLLDSVETPDEKYKLLKQINYLSEYGLENHEHFVETVVTPKEYIDQTFWSYDCGTNLLSTLLAAKGFLNGQLRAVLLPIGSLGAERESILRQQDELSRRYEHTVNQYLSGNCESIPPPESDIQSSWLTACSKCRKLYIAGNKFCGHCGGELVSLFIRCPKCNKQNGTNTPLCEHCNAELPHKFGSLPRCSYCGTENRPKPYYDKCSQCESSLKPLSRCFVCGKHDRDPQQNDMHGCSHGIRVHWSSPPKS